MTAAAEINGHDLKCWPEFFEAIRVGRKKFEVRLNDRNFQVGDLLTLREWDNAAESYTGRLLLLRVTYILPLDDRGAAGHVAMSIETQGFGAA